MRHPADLGPVDVTRFLSSLAERGHVSASPKNQALGALPTARDACRAY